MNKHTWMVDDYGHDLRFQAEELVSEIGTEREWVCVGISDEEGFAEVVALCHPINAPLISSAPDLLEALKVAVGVMKDHNIDESMSGEFEIFTDAIAKAEVTQ